MIKSISYDQAEIINNILKLHVVNARKYHSYFWVFEKTDKKIEYV